MKAALTLALLLPALTAAAQPLATVTLESLAAPLLEARTYCESGKRNARIATDYWTGEWRYRICASNDGRFKYVENPGQPHQTVTWSDGRTLRRYVNSARVYQEYALTERAAEYNYDRPAERTPALHSRLFRAATRSGAGLDLLGSLRSYGINGELSDARRIAYEFRASDQRTAERLYVAEGSIVRHESWYDGTLRGYVEVTAREVNRPLSESELTHEVPLLTRYSQQNNPAVFVTGLFVVAAVAGLAFWTWMFIRAEHPEDIASLRRRLWRYYFWALAAFAALLGLLTIATWNGSGHPPAIVYVLLMAVLAAIAFGLMAVFLSASYVARAIARRRAD